MIPEHRCRGCEKAVVLGTLLIDTADTRIGQVNALPGYEVGGALFGETSRVTATTRFGEGHVIDIPRETELGGAIHSKGVLILAAFLAARYARRWRCATTAGSPPAT